MTTDASIGAEMLPAHVKHFRPPGMRHAVWDCVHVLENAITRGPKTLTHVCLLCVKSKGTSAWQDALCRISNTSNAMKHMKSRHKDWESSSSPSTDVSPSADVRGVADELTEDDAESPKSFSKASPAREASSKQKSKKTEKATEKAEKTETAGAKRKASGSEGGGRAAEKEPRAKKPAIETKPKATPATTAAGGALTGKVVVITGASGGIGAAIAEKLALEGASVMLGARRLHALTQTRTAIVEKTRASNRVAICVTDVTQREDLHALVKEATEQFGDVDILINNAGVMPFELLRNVNQDSWERTVDINCKGVLNGVAAVLPRMLERKSGHIVNISSDAGRKVFPGLGVYSASKMFVEGISQALRLENIGSGLRVTSIQPGNVATELVHHGQSTSGGDDEAMQLYGAPSDKEVLKPQDIANAVFYAVTQPAYVAVNEILVEPRDEPI